MLKPPMKMKEQMTMINFKEMFENIEPADSLYQKKVNVISPIGVYWGYSNDGNMRISFLSSQNAPVLKSTKLLKVTQGFESEGVFWTCFDLLQSDAKIVFYAFCENIVESVINTKNEQDALLALRKRYITWKNLFKNKTEQKLSKEAIQGLFGELYFLKNYMLDKYSSEEAINSWSGIDSKSKDFSIGSTWYEIKTIGSNVSELHISSLAQLSSSLDGHIVSIKVEAMSNSYNQPDSDICSLVNTIVSLLNNEIIEEMFLQKVSGMIGNVCDENLAAKFAVKNVDFYLVDNNFPRLTEENKVFAEIGNVQYSLIINALDKYKEKVL